MERGGEGRAGGEVPWVVWFGRKGWWGLFYDRVEKIWRIDGGILNWI